jgi:hypothetical protein
VIDGLESEKNSFITCAPKHKTQFGENYNLNGICYEISDTLKDQPYYQKPIEKLDSWHAECGFSVHHRLPGIGFLVWSNYHV